MGLASALTTALTGMTAAETQVAVDGNNLANSQTNGFKQSRSLFETQYLQTYGVGSGPTAGDGGTNPTQVGLGVRVAEITPQFTQGTISISSSPSDLAIQGDGFFEVQDSSGGTLYTRNGAMKTNAANELVTSDGNRVLGFGVDGNYSLQPTSLVPLTIPLGAKAVAQATQNVNLQGVLSPTGQIADTAGIAQSGALGDSNFPQANAATVTAGVAPIPSAAAVAVGNAKAAGGSFTEGTSLQYKFAFADASGTETAASSALAVTIPVSNGAADNSVVLTNLPTSGAAYPNVHVYRAAGGSSNFVFVGNATAGGAFSDTNAALGPANTALNTSTLSGNYNYVITYAGPGAQETRPSQLLGPLNLVNGRVELTNLPTPPTIPGQPAYTTINIYRNLATDPSKYFLVGSADPAVANVAFTDSKSDAQISNLATPGNQALDLVGPKINTSTLLTNVIQQNGNSYTNPFKVGNLDVTASKGGRSLATKTFAITATSTVQDLMSFLQQATGIQTTASDPQHPLPASKDTIPGELGTVDAGVVLDHGQIRVISDNGVDNSISFDTTSFKLTDASGVVSTPNLGFGSVQQANGLSTGADFVAYDSLGTPLNVRITTVLERTSGATTTYRWFADSAANSTTGSASIAVGTGEITFDGKGTFLSSTNDTISIARDNLASINPLSFKLNFNSVTALTTKTSSLAVSSQDGSSEGTLSSFSIGNNGLIKGVFSNGVSRDLGQIRMARFSNPAGLEQKGANTFAQGLNSGLAIEGNPGVNGMGTVVAGAVEQSNTDVGKNLIDLVLASTQYRASSEVISKVQQLFDQLLLVARQ